MVLRIGSKGEAVTRLQVGLAALGYRPGPADGIFGATTEAAVVELQRAAKILQDGVAGPTTLAAYNNALEVASRSHPDRPWAEWLVKAVPAPQSEENPPSALLKWVTCPADVAPGYDGLPRTVLREDVAAAYRKLCDAVHSQGGVVTSAGGRRALSTTAGASQSRRSFHYVGRAFDLAVPTGLSDPARDPFVIERDPVSERHWIVWCRSRTQAVPERTVLGCFVTHHTDAKGKRYTQLHARPVTAPLFSFTALALEHGFARIAGRRSFFAGGQVSGAEWWHFQWESGLKHGTSTFGGDLLRVYTPEKAASFRYWNEVKDSRFGIEWL